MSPGRVGCLPCTSFLLGYNVGLTVAASSWVTCAGEMRGSGRGAWKRGQHTVGIRWVTVGECLVFCDSEPQGAQSDIILTEEETEAWGGRAADPRLHGELPRWLGSQVQKVLRWGAPVPPLCPPPCSWCRYLALCHSCPTFPAVGSCRVRSQGTWWGRRPAAAELEAAPGWSWSPSTINTVSSSVCPSLRAVPRGKGWPGQISGGVSLHPLPLRGQTPRRQDTLGAGCGVCGCRLGFMGARALRRQSRPPAYATLSGC